MLVSIAVLCLRAAGRPLAALRHGSVRSPDGNYVASLTPNPVTPSREFAPKDQIEDLTLRSAKLPLARPLLSEVNVVGILWDPGAPHRLIYAESAAYGTGKVVVWNGRVQNVLWSRPALLGDLAWDRARHRLSFWTREEQDHPYIIDKEFGPLVRRTVRFR